MILSLARVAVCHRPGFKDFDSVDDDRSVIWVPAIDETVSSTKLRREVRLGHCIDKDVPGVIARYIEQQRLYKE